MSRRDSTNMTLFNDFYNDEISLSEIKNNRLSCAIRCKTQEEADALVEFLNDDWGWAIVWYEYGEDTAYHIADGYIDDYGDEDNYDEMGVMVYEFLKN